MPVQSEVSRVQYAGNSSNVTAYAVPFLFLANADVRVVLTLPSGAETLMAETTHYVLSGAGNESGGSLRTVAAYGAAFKLTIYREPQETQTIQFPGTGALPADTITRGLDKLTMLVQSLGRKVRRTLRFSDSGDEMEVVPGSARSLKLLGFDGAGSPLLYDDTALLALLSLKGSLQGAPTAFWNDEGGRLVKVPDFEGQVGLQRDDWSLWYATGTAPGNWTSGVLDEVSMAPASPVRAPSQASVKTYVDAAEVSAKSHAEAQDSTYLPPGAIVPYGGATAPAGWLLCYGQAVSRVTYAALFAAISTTYGVGDGSTTFNVPDLRGRVAAGKDDMGGSAASRMTNSGTGNPGVDGAVLGAAGGADRHTLTVAQMPSHRHLLVRAGANSTDQTLSATGMIAQIANYGANDFCYTIAEQASEPDVIQSGLAGSSEAHPQLPPTIILLCVNISDFRRAESFLSPMFSDGIGSFH